MEKREATGTGGEFLLFRRLKFFDPLPLLNGDREMFVDELHLSPQGCLRVAEGYRNCIKERIFGYTRDFMLLP